MERRGDDLILSPSDLGAFLACRHKTALDWQRAHGKIRLERRPRRDAKLIADRGHQHEAAFLAQLEAEGREVVTIPFKPRAEALAGTEAAMRAGAEVIYQAAFEHAGWQGFADFLVRTDVPSALGPWSYEAYDTKLARYPKPYFILQLAFYSESIGRLTGVIPEHMHVVLGTQERQSFRYRDFDAYVRRVRSELRAHLAGPEVQAPPYPYPVQHCEYCDWWKHCADRRERDDHLSLVATLSRGQSLRLEADGIPTLEALGTLPAEREVPRLAGATLTDLRLQAALQSESRRTRRPTRELLPLEEKRGFARLPEPSPGDVFFDLEGDPWWGEDGLEYLWGSTTADGHRAQWAHDRAQEKQAFEEWVDWVTERLAADPGMHVYHYNHYEVTAVKGLMSRYGAREDEVDELLRREVFVDLYAVVRQALRVGEPKYSLKNLERFYPLERDAAVTEAGGAILAYQEWLEHRDPDLLASIEAYNADDCGSTLALRDWLLALREEATETFGHVLPDRNAIEPQVPTEKAERERAELEALRERLLADPADPVRTLLADLLDYHRRDAKPEYWALFDRLTKTPKELCDDDTEAVGLLEPASDVERESYKKSWLHPLRFPKQQYKLRPGGKVVDPETGDDENLHAVDDERGLVWIQRGKGQKTQARPWPRALIPPWPIPQPEQRAALRRLAHRVLEEGTAPTGSLDAACDLLTCAVPRYARPPHDGTLTEKVAALDASALFVQGPPGAGKTYWGAQLVLDALRRGLRVGVTATSHEAIHGLLREVEAHAGGLAFAGLKKASEHPETQYESDRITSSQDNKDFPPPADVGLVAGTGWLFAREAMVGAVDVLFVDEAGQVALADALAMAGAARSVVLLGDPQQLAHVSQGTHPDGAGVSVLEHLLGDLPTVPPHRGVFLDRTRRMHPEICAFVSEVMYESRLESEPWCARQVVRSGGLRGAGVRHLPVAHEGNTQTAEEEATAIAGEVRTLLDGGIWVDGEGTERPLGAEDVLVVAPYNAQVRELRARVPDGVRVGTVDKFQGQEAPVVFFSMTSSSGEEVPRGMEFLFSRNRLNVAVSRAQCLAVIVYSPALLTAPCSSVEQMRLVNALCRFVELAEAGPGPPR